MENIILNQLKTFYKENEDLLTLKKDFEYWDSRTSDVLFESNSSVKGKILFTSKGYYINELGHFFGLISNKKLLKFAKRRYQDKAIGSHYGEYKFPCGTNGKKLFEHLEKLCKKIIDGKSKEKKQIEEKEKIKEEIKEEKRLQKLKVSQSNVLSELDKDGNGEVDVIEGNDLSLLLKKHQKSIIGIDRSYVQQFIKISSYLKTKKNNIQLIFKSIKDTPNQQTLYQYVEVLKDDVHSYNLILFNSLNMIVSLVEDDMITFYEIHEMFDNLNIFDSKHEKDVSQKLNNIGDGLKDLMYSIEEMGRNIESQMGELSYVTEQSNQQLENQLQSIDSSIKTNTLLTGINSYQTYKLRKGE